MNASRLSRRCLPGWRARVAPRPFTSPASSPRYPPASSETTTSFSRAPHAHRTNSRSSRETRSTGKWTARRGRPCILYFFSQEKKVDIPCREVVLVSLLTTHFSLEGFFDAFTLSIITFLLVFSPMQADSTGDCTVQFEGGQPGVVA